MHRYLVSGIYGFLFLMPLISFTANGSSPWEFPKQCFTVVSVLILFTSFIFWKFRSSVIDLRYNKILLFTFLFTVTSLISYSLSINPYLSFWGDRLLPSDSMVTILAGLLLSALLLQLNISIKHLQYVFGGVVTLQILCGLIQIFDIDLPWWGFHYLVFGTQGQPVAYATLLGCLAPFVCTWFFRQENRALHNWLFGTLLFLLNFAVLHTGSRTPLAVLWLTFLLVGVYYFLHRNHFHSVKKILALGLIIAASTGLFQLQKSQSEIKQKLSSAMVNKGLETRTLIFKSGVEAWKEKPLFGYGPQMFLSAHRPHQTPEINSFEYWESGWAKAHNHLADLLVNQGLSGLLITFLIYGFLIFQAAKLYFKKSANAGELFSLACFAGYNYLFLANLTAFNMIPTQVLFTIFPVLFSVGLNDVSTRTVTLRSSARAAALGATFLAAALLFFNTLNVWRADLLLQSWLRNDKLKADTIKSLELTLQASALNPGEALYYCYTGRLYTEMLGRNYKALKPADLQTALQAIEENLNQCMSAGPGIIHYVQQTAETYQELYFKGVIASPEKSFHYYTEVQKVIPYNPKIYVEIGRIHLKAGNEAAFLEAENKALQLKPDYVPPYIELLQHFYRNNDFDAVSQLADQFSQTTFNSSEFVPLILDLVTIAEIYHDERSKEIFQNSYNRYKHLIPAVKKN